MHFEINLYIGNRKYLTRFVNEKIACWYAFKILNHSKNVLMKSNFNKLSVFVFGVFALILLCGYAGDDYHDGYASPDDGLCGDCHTPQASSGTITIVNLPSIVEAGKTYDNLKIRIQRIDPTRVEGGFQMSVTDAFGSVGNLEPIAPNTDADLHQSAHFGTLVQYLEQSELNHDLPFPSNGIVEWPFKWTAPSNTGSITFTAAGVLTNGDFTVGGDKSVSRTYTRTVLPPISISTYGLDPVCAGPGGIAGVYEPTGGNGGPYFYSWSNGQNTQEIYNLNAGIYTVTVSDANGFTSTSTVVISTPPPINISASVTPVSCNGGSNGGIDITVNGAQGSLSYNWSNGSISQDLVSIPAGVYTVTVQDQNFCTSTKIIPVLEPSAIQVNSSIHDVNCFGDSTGYININPIGGKSPYTFNWSNNSTLQNQINLPAGNYSLTITDNNACKTTNLFTVVQGAKIILADTIIDISCSGAPLGQINLSVSGGTGPFSYDWDNDGFETPDNDSQDLDSLSAGAYIVEVTDSLGCLVRDTFTVAQPPAFILSTLTTNLLCNGIPTGAIDLSVSGGTGPFHYDWDNDGFEDPDNDPQDLDSLSAGAYIIEVTDSSGCLVRDTFTVMQPPALMLTVSVTGLLCNGASTGMINLNAAGGTGQLSYDWDNDGFEDPDNDPQDLDSLSAGTYIVEVTDSLGCHLRDTFMVAQPQTLTLSTTTTNILCNGASSGSIDLTPGGGTAGYNYLWSNGLTTQDINNLPAGTYTVTVTDANGCTKTVTDTINQPSEITLVTTVDNVNCFAGSDGSIDLTASGGIPGYTYLWSNGSVLQDIGNLPPGAYTVTLTDANGCTQVKSDTVIEPAEITLSTSVVHVSCFGAGNGSVQLTPGGGAGNYAFLWSNGALTQNLANLPADTFSVTVSDLNGCTQTTSAIITEPEDIIPVADIADVTCFGLSNGSVHLATSGGIPPYSFVWSNDAMTQDIENVAAGPITATITDATGCTKDVFYTIEQPELLALTPTKVNISCVSGAVGGILLAVNGGTPGYTYLWSNGDTTQNLSNVPIGVYTVTTTDANGCSASIADTVLQSPPLSVTLASNSVACYGDSTGSIVPEITGGAGIYTFLWSNGSAGSILMDVPAGTYSLTVTDIIGCTDTVSGIVTQPAGAMNVASTSSGVTCYGGSDGSAVMSVNGGTAPYSYHWSNGATTPGLEDIPVGDYLCTITDANGCIYITKATVLGPPDLTVAVDSTAAASQGENNGAVYISPDGATPPYNYIWRDLITGDTISTEEDLTNVAAGTYQLGVTDANGCVFANVLTVNILTTATWSSGPGIDWKLFPNPNNGDFTIQGEAGIDAGLTVRIQNVFGKEVYVSAPISMHAFESGYEIDGVDLSPGVYLIQLWAADKIYTCRPFVVAENK